MKCYCAILGFAVVVLSVAVVTLAFRVKSLKYHYQYELTPQYADTGLYGVIKLEGVYRFRDGMPCYEHGDESGWYAHQKPNKETTNE